MSVRKQPLVSENAIRNQVKKSRFLREDIKQGKIGDTKQSSDEQSQIEDRRGSRL